MIKVIKNNKIIATHENSQNVIDSYDCDIIICNDNERHTKMYYYGHACDMLFMNYQASQNEADKKEWQARRKQYKKLIEDWFKNNSVEDLEA